MSESTAEKEVDKVNELQKLLQPGKFVFTILISSLEYPERMEDLLKFAARTWKQTCFVTTNKPSSAILDIIGQLKLKPDSFVIVDAVSRGAGIEKKEKNVVYISSPGAITELGIRVGDILEKEKVEAVIFDSVSALLIHARESEVLEFIHVLVSRTRGKRIPAIFPVLQEDLGTPAVKNLNMFADSVIDLVKK